MGSYDGSTFIADTTSFRELEWSNEMNLHVFLKLQDSNAEVNTAQVCYIHLYRTSK